MSKYKAIIFDFDGTLVDDIKLIIKIIVVIIFAYKCNSQPKLLQPKTTNKLLFQNLVRAFTIQIKYIKSIFINF